METTEIVVSLLGIATICMVFFKREYSLLMLALILPFEKLFIESGIPGINITTFIIIPLCLIYLVHIKNPFKGHSIKYDQRNPIILLMAITTLTAFTPIIMKLAPSYDLKFQIFELKRWLTYFLLFFIYSRGVNNRDFLGKLILFIALGYSLETFHVFKDLIIHGRSRLYGSLGNPNELGAYLSIFWVVVWAAIHMVKERPWLSYFLKGILIVGILCALRTLSRGAFLTLIATFLVFAFYRSKQLFIFSLLGVIILISCYSVVLPQFIVERVNETFTGYGGDIELNPDSAGSRIKFWKAGLRMFADNPILGVGFRQSQRWQVYYGEPYGITKHRPMHNMFLRILAEEGIVGFSIFAWMLWRGYRSGAMLAASKDPFYNKVGISLCVIVVGFCISMFFGDRFFQGALVGNFFIFCGIVRAGILQNETTAITKT